MKSYKAFTDHHFVYKQSIQAFDHIIMRLELKVVIKSYNISFILSDYGKP